VFTFEVDTVAPLITPTVPAVMGNSVVGIFSGTTLDPAPVDAQVASLELQRDDEDWRGASLYAPDSSGEHLWLSVWLLPSEDGVTHTVRFRATDYGNNVTTTDWHQVVVDTVAPRITVTEHTHFVDNAGTMTALAGTVTDGYGVEAVTLSFIAEDGTTTVVTPTLVNNTWSYAPVMTRGTYNVIVAATDIAGNQRILSQNYEVILVPWEPVAHWKLDDITGTIAIDASGNNITGTLESGAAFTSTIPPRFSIGSAVSFDGVDDFIYVLDSIHTNLDIAGYRYRTVAAWFNVNDKDLTDRQVIWEEGGATTGLNIYVEKGAINAGAYNGDGWSSGAWISSTAITSGQWHHVALVISGNTTLTPEAMSVYLDGALIGQAPGTGLGRHSSGGGIGRPMM